MDLAFWVHKLNHSMTQYTYRWIAHIGDGIYHHSCKENMNRGELFLKKKFRSKLTEWNIDFVTINEKLAIKDLIFLICKILTTEFWNFSCFKNQWSTKKVLTAKLENKIFTNDKVFYLCKGENCTVNFWNITPVYILTY